MKNRPKKWANLFFAAACAVSSAEAGFVCASRHDVVVAGGTAAAVEEAVRASESGCRVLLLAPRAYLGEDSAGNLTCLEKGVAPLEAKRSLDRRLIAAVRPLFGYTPKRHSMTDEEIDALKELDLAASVYRLSSDPSLIEPWRDDGRKVFSDYARKVLTKGAVKCR